MPEGYERTFSSDELVSPGTVVTQSRIRIHFLLTWIGPLLAVLLMVPYLLAGPAMKCGSSLPMLPLAFSLLPGLAAAYDERSLFWQLSDCAIHVAVPSFPDMSKTICIKEFVDKRSLKARCLSWNPLQLLGSSPVLVAMSISEKYDISTDTMFPALAYPCDSEISKTYALSWSFVPVVGPLLQQAFTYLSFSMWMAILCLVFVYVCQALFGAIALLRLEPNAPLPTIVQACRDAAMLSVATILEEVADEEKQVVVDAEMKITKKNAELQQQVEELTNEKANLEKEQQAWWNSKVREYMENGGGMEKMYKWLESDSYRKDYEAKKKAIDDALAEVQRNKDSLQSGLGELQTKQSQHQEIQDAFNSLARKAVAIKVFGENVLQMNNQATFYSLTFASSTLKARIQILVSLGLSASSALNTMMTYTKKPTGTTKYQLYAVLVVTIFFLAYILAKIVGAWLCESSVFVLSHGGCLEQDRLSEAHIQS